MIDITLPWPPSINHYWRNNRGVTHISTEGRRYREAVAAAAVGANMALGRISVAVEAFPPDRRRRDLDNLCKSLLDALQHAGCYEDDSQIDRLSLTRMKQRPGGAVRVEIRPL